MKRNFEPLEKVVILNSYLLDEDNDSLVGDFVCFGTVLRTYQERIDGCFVTTVVAAGTDGRIYKDQSNDEGVWFSKPEEFKGRIQAEKLLNPESSKKMDEMLLALSVYVRD